MILHKSIRSPFNEGCRWMNSSPIPLAKQVYFSHLLPLKFFFSYETCINLPIKAIKGYFQIL